VNDVQVKIRAARLAGPRRLVRASMAGRLAQAEWSCQAAS